MSEPWQYKPAADLDLGPLARARSVRREVGLVSAVTHHAATGLLRLYLTAFHRMRVHGRENLPRRTPFVVIANHASHLDALILAAALPRVVRAQTYPVAAGDVFFETGATSFASAMLINALPLWRKKSVGHALADLRERLARGESGLILFPEGARSRDGAMLPFKAGLGMLVAGSRVPVVPAYLRGAFEAYPPGKKLPRPRKIEVRVGPALDFSGLPDEREGWQEVAAATRRAVDALAAG